jgi:branched-chain amino acid transport system permease protein
MSPAMRYGLFALWVLILASTPLWAENYVVHLAITIAMYTTLALSWNFIGGFAGYPSFATAAFFGIGCYAGALSKIAGLPSGLAWLFASAVVAVFAGLFGAIILRLRGHYFAVASFGLVEVVRLVLSSWDRLTGGGDGLNVPLVPGGPDVVARIFLAVMLTIMVFVTTVTVLVDRGKLGFGLRCIQQNEDAADMVGINVTLYKVIALVLSAMFCGTVGAVYASWVGYIDPVDSFSILMTIKVPVMCLLGGAGTVFGPVVGAGAFLLLDQVIWSNFLDYNLAILGAVIVIVIFFLPGGLLRIPFRELVARVAGHKHRTDGELMARVTGQRHRTEVAP